MASKRDPRVDPRCGDVLSARRFDFVVIYADEDMVAVHRFGKRQTCFRVTSEVWRREMANAQVVNCAEAQKGGARG